MSESAGLAPGRSVPDRVSGRAREVGSPVYHSLVREPVRQGRLRLGGTTGIDRYLAIIGLVALFGALLSLVAGDLWRHGGLVSLNDTEGRWVFVPQSLFGLTLLLLFIGWLLFLWGALRASLPVRLGGALLFLLANADIGRPSAPAIGGDLALRWGPPAARAGYFAAAGVIVLYSLINLRPRWGRRARPAMLLLLGGSLVALFGGLLWMGITAIHRGLVNSATTTLNADIDTISNILFPIVLYAAVGLVDFSYSVSGSFTAPAWHWQRATIRILLVGVIAVKLWIQLGRHLGEWAAFIGHTPISLLTTTLAIVFVGLVAVLGRSLRRRRASREQAEDVKERVMIGGVLAESAVVVVIFLLLSAASFAFTQTSSTAAFRFIADVARFTDRYSVWIRLIPWTVMLVVGVYLLTARGKREILREAGLGLILIGGWNVPFFLLGALNISTFYNEALLDISVTAVLAFVVMADLVLVGLNRLGLRAVKPFLDQASAIAIIAIVLLTWLMFTRGDFVSAIAHTVLQPIPLIAGSVVVAFGTAYTLLVDSNWASDTTPRLPANSRVLLWIGYLLLSVVILTWIQATHSSDLASVVQHNGFSDIGIPFAAWLFIRRPWTPAEAEVAALPAEVGMMEAAEIAVDEGDQVEPGWTWTESPEPHAWGDPAEWDHPPQA
jgi:hypothetical protein